MNDLTDTPSLAVAAQVEALLFALGKPLSRLEIVTMLQCASSELEEALSILQENAATRGIVLVDDGTTVELRISGHAATLVERIRKEEYSRDIGRAGLEVLTAILYRGPLTRSEIDFIRGVNSSQTLRTLTMRGLVRKATQAKSAPLSGGRQSSYPYEPTTELLSTLGVTHISDLPDYASVREKLTALEAAYRNANAQASEEIA